MSASPARASFVVAPDRMLEPEITRVTTLVSSVAAGVTAVTCKPSLISNAAGSRPLRLPGLTTSTSQNPAACPFRSNVVVSDAPPGATCVAPAIACWPVRVSRAVAASRKLVPVIVTDTDVMLTPKLGVIDVTVGGETIRNTLPAVTGSPPGFAITRSQTPCARLSKLKRA